MNGNNQQTEPFSYAMSAIRPVLIPLNPLRYVDVSSQMETAPINKTLPSTLKEGQQVHPPTKKTNYSL
jgi:hypothetical protein